MLVLVQGFSHSFLAGSGPASEFRLETPNRFRLSLVHGDHRKDHGVNLEYTVEDLDREAASSRPVWERRQMELAGEAKDESRRAK